MMIEIRGFSAGMVFVQLTTLATADDGARQLTDCERIVVAEGAAWGVVNPIRDGSLGWDAHNADCGYANSAQAGDVANALPARCPDGSVLPTNCQRRETRSVCSGDRRESPVLRLNNDPDGRASHHARP